MILDILTYIVMVYGGHIIIASALIICTLVLKNKLSQLIRTLQTLQTYTQNNPTHPALPVTMLEPNKKKKEKRAEKPLSEDESTLAKRVIAASQRRQNSE